MRRTLLAAPLAALPLLVAATASAAPSPVVISEWRSRGPNGAADEFVELYNRSNAAVAIGGWRIRMSDAAGTITQLANVPAGNTLEPGQFFL
ncbi:MAG: lamin tail domain-containing protein, partial [Deltaproteobacteria bacterium]|nr:lamin tail domain-containing protein [Deltaproteobacteria bacterium]